MVNTMLVAKRRSARRYTKAVGTAVSSQEVDSVKMNTMVVGIAWRKDRANGLQGEPALKASNCKFSV